MYYVKYIFLIHNIIVCLGQMYNIIFPAYNRQLNQEITSYIVPRTCIFPLSHVICQYFHH
jgi:hypothetical protein